MATWTHAKSVVGVLLLFVTTMASGAWASGLLAAGTGVVLTGTTAAGEADLAGSILHDEVVDFSIRSAAGVLFFAGKLQHRIVRSDMTGSLHFYYRIRDTVPGLNGRVASFEITDFTGIDPLHADYRLDGLGTVNCAVANRSTTGRSVKFGMPRPVGITGGAESRFCFVKTKATAFRPGGMVTIHLVGGLSVNIHTMRPSP